MDKAKVLIIDDMYQSLFAITVMLQGEYIVYVAKTGRDGIEVAKKNKPDVILLDIVMPEMDGYEVITALKGDESTKDIPVIFITGSENPNDEIQGLLLGAVDYVIKPFSESAIKLRINNFIKQKKTQELSDPSSKLVPRKFFFDMLSGEWRKIVSSKGFLSFIILHINNFENYNEKHGHEHGENALNSLALVITKIVKDENVQIARWRGNEVAVALPYTTMDEAIRLADDIATDFERYSAAPSSKILERLTVCVGVATTAPMQDDNHSLDDFILEASVSLSNAKKGVKISSSSTVKHNDVVDVIMAFSLKLEYDEMLDISITKMMDLQIRTRVRYIYMKIMHCIFA